MKRLMGSLVVGAFVAVTASAVDAGDRFNPTDRQRPGRKFYMWRQATPPVVQPAATIPVGDVTRSFSFEPGEAAASGAACCCKTNCGCNVAAAPAKDSDGTVRSFSYEPEAVAAPATRTSTRRFPNRGAERLWRKQHPGVR